MIEIDEDKRTEAVDRFVSLAGLSESEARNLVNAALQAAVDQTLDIIMGSGAVPSAMTSARADELRYVCAEQGRILTQPEVSVLFRTTPANARSILTTMSATYAKLLHPELVQEMKHVAQVKQIGSAEKYGWRVTFPDKATYETMLNELQRLHLSNYVTLHDLARAVEFDQATGTPQGDLDILALVGLPAPDSG